MKTPEEIAVDCLACSGELQNVIEAIQVERDETDEAYRQRNILVRALARLYPSGIRRTDIPGWDEQWHGCCFIDLPTGQISYHYHTSQSALFADLPPYEKPFDGHDKEIVHARLLSISGGGDGIFDAARDVVDYFNGRGSKSELAEFLLTRLHKALGGHGVIR